MKSPDCIESFPYKRIIVSFIFLYVHTKFTCPDLIRLLLQNFSGTV